MLPAYCRILYPGHGGDERLQTYDTFRPSEVVYFDRDPAVNDPVYDDELYITGEYANIRQYIWRPEFDAILVRHSHIKPEEADLVLGTLKYRGLLIVGTAQFTNQFGVSEASARPELTPVELPFEYPNYAVFRKLLPASPAVAAAS